MDCGHPNCMEHLPLVHAIALVTTVPSLCAESAHMATTKSNLEAKNGKGLVFSVHPVPEHEHCVRGFAWVHSAVCMRVLGHISARSVWDDTSVCYDFE